jgi:hypothetical protein
MTDTTNPTAKPATITIKPADPGIPDFLNRQLNHEDLLRPSSIAPSFSVGSMRPLASMRQPCCGHRTRRYRSMALSQSGQP